MSRFLVDAMCGDLLAYLRMCGHDTAYAPDRGLEADDAILAAAAADAEDRTVDDDDRIADAEDRTADAAGRTILTRDRQLAARAEDAILLESQDTEVQLRSLADAGVDLELAEEPERCGRCNGSLERVDPGQGATTPSDAPDPTAEPVWRCEDCGQHFWRGSHWDGVAATLADVRAGDAGTRSPGSQ